MPSPDYVNRCTACGIPVRLEILPVPEGVKEMWLDALGHDTHWNTEPGFPLMVSHMA